MLTEAKPGTAEGDTPRRDETQRTDGGSTRDGRTGAPRPLNPQAECDVTRVLIPCSNAAVPSPRLAARPRLRVSRVLSVAFLLSL